MTPRRPGRPTGSLEGVTKQAIVEIALNAFAENGYRGCSIAAIAREAGISQAGLLHHFGTKKDLLAAVLQRRDEIDEREFWNAEPDGTVGFEALAGLLALTERNSKRPGIVRLYSTMSGEATNSEHPARDWLEQHLAHTYSLIVLALQWGIDKGKVRDDAPVPLIAQTIIATMDGIQVQWLLNPDDVDMVGALDEVLAGLRVRWEVPSGLATAHRTSATSALASVQATG